MAKRLRTEFSCVGAHRDDHYDLHTRYNATRSVRDYGAVGDNLTDDTAAFQAALNDAGRYALFVPAGNYVISQKLQGNAEYLALYGEGRWQSRIVSTTALDGLIEVSGGLEIRNLWLRAYGGGACLIRSSGVTNDVLVADSWLDGTVGPLISGKIANLTLSRCIVELAQMGFSLESVYLNISDCIFYNVSKWMLKAVGCTGINLSNLLLEVRGIVEGVEPAIQLDNCKDVNLNNLNFQRAYDALGEYPGAISLVGCTGVHLSNIRVRDFVSGLGSMALALDGCSQVIGRNVSIYGESYTPAIGVQIVDSARYNIEAMVTDCTQASSITNSPDGTLTLL